MRRLIGTYTLGIQSIRVYGRAGNGAEFDCGAAEMTLGLDHDWPGVVTELCHEAIEMCAAQMGLRWAPAPDFSGAADGWLFVMTHPQMSEVSARVGHMLSDALPDLATAHKKHARK
jgi:hypothetical protein